MDNNMTMAQLLAEEEKQTGSIRRGNVVRGSIFQIRANDLIVNIGGKADGIVPLDEISSDSANADLSKFSEGQQVDVYIIKTDDGDGNVLLSLKKVTMGADWDDLEKLYAEDATINVKVNNAVKGGVIAYYKEARGFIPASQLSVRFIKDIKEFVGKELDVKIVEFNKDRKKAVFSHKVIAKAALDAAKAEVWGKISEGSIVKGEVRRITNFGVFVDLGGIDGLVHFSELSWGRIKKAEDVVSIGEMLEVKIIGINQEKEKISLSLKQVSADPWSNVSEKYIVGQIYDAKVVNLTDFGAFVELEPGVEGLIHVSQISTKRVEKPSDELKIGEVKQVKLMELDNDNKKIKLSIKEVIAPKEEVSAE